MPNWCANSVAFIGSDKDVATFKDGLVETVSSQKIAGARALVMIIQEQLEPGYIEDLSVAILHDRVKNNFEIDTQIFNTINHIWKGFDKDNLSDKWEDVWKKIKCDWGYVRSIDANTFGEFIKHISEPVEYATKPDGYIPFDFAQFCPLRLTSLLLGFNSQTEEWIEPLVKTLPDNNYHYQSSMWGTKWNAVDVCESRVQPDNGFALAFSTAWSPPIPVLEKLSEQYPNLIIDVIFSECNMDYQGRMVFKAGETIFEREDTIHWLEDDERNAVDTAPLEWMDMPLEKLLGGA